MHVYRWDLDKTYLDTDIHSMRGLVRAALEGAAEKRNVPGSASLLRALVEHDPACRVAILSGSPRQMRTVLEEKLALDGIRWDEMILKDSLGHIRRGRLRAVRSQVGYKLPALLRARAGMGPSVHETLFGDDSEVDALVYTLYAEALAGRLTEGELSRIMKAGDAYDEAVRTAVSAMGRLPRADAVEDIFIRLDRGVPPAWFRKLGSRVVPVFSWLQAALVLFKRERLGAELTARVVRASADEAGMDEHQLASHVQDIVRRHHVDAQDIRELLSQTRPLESASPAILQALDHLGRGSAPPRAPSHPDYLGFLRAVERSEPED